MPIDYVTAYEISERIPDWPLACVGFLPLIAGAAIIWGRRRFKWAQPHWVFAVISIFFGVMWIATAGLSTLHEDSAAYDAYKVGHFQIVEGVVSDFHPMPYEGHQDECFSVEDQRFCYSDYEIAPGFHNATSHGGPTQAGLPVRISYSNGRILKLEVPRGALPTPAQSAAITSQGEHQWQQRAENDPMQQEMTTACLFTAMCWTLWWNVQWRRAIRLWHKPPYRPWVVLGLRAFFALNFVGSVTGLVKQIHSHPVVKGQLISTIEITSAMCTVVAFMSFFALWRTQRRDARDHS